MVGRGGEVRSYSMYSHFKILNLENKRHTGEQQEEPEGLKTKSRQVTSN